MLPTRQLCYQCHNTISNHKKKITSGAFLTFIKHTRANCDSVAQAYISNFQLFFCRIDFGRNSFKYGIKTLEIDQHFLLKSVRISHSNL